MPKFFVVIALSGVALAAQDVPNWLPPDLTAYLELTESQVGQIAQTNRDFTTLTASRQNRSFQVQLEISVELGKPDPDAMALGLRYRELESIRRDIASQRERTVTAVQSFLTATQKQKLTSLTEALRIYRTACNATDWNFLAPLPTAIAFSGNRLGGSFGFGCNARAGTVVRQPFPGSSAVPN
ncbi:MAG: hypothetical protein H7039_00725 [Bryobacteraceae bacterium]|nr:hypothetical protein [Bryobacteraceae bacterium]